jgi:hypothetical protein
MAMDLLDSQITDEFFKGVSDLPLCDHHHFSHSLLSILSKSKHYKQAWYLNVTTARQRQDRLVAAAGHDRAESVSNSRLLHWFQTGRLQ